jgi:hypothetical protein
MRSLAGIAGACLVAMGCHGEASRATISALRPACADAEYWDGAACKPRGDAAAQIARGKQALAVLDVEVAAQALTAAEHGGPLSHDAHVTLWEQRGIAAAYVNDAATATQAFDMMLALDPGHFLSYTLSPKATFVFEKVRTDARAHGVPALDVTWPRGQRVGEPMPIDLTVVADPKHFFRRATLFVRTQGEPSWRATDVELGRGGEHRVTLPAITAPRALSLELYLKAYDDRGNEVLTWADPARPREIPLRYDPPVAWYRNTWVYVAGIVVVGAATALTVYELTLAPPDKISGGVTVR